jgi:hypothetical protein
MSFLGSIPVVTDQVGVGALGLVEVTESPLPSTAMHSEEDGHEMPFNEVEATLALLHVAVAPSAGSLVLKTSPSLSTAMHVVGEAKQDTPFSAPLTSAWRLVHVALAP